MGTWVRLVAWAVAVIGAIGLALNLLFFEVWRLPTDDPLAAVSVEPTLSAGDLVLVTRRGSVARGDLLRCVDPQAPGRFVVARAVAHNGDHIEIRDELVNIDGKRDPSARACDPMTLRDPRSGEDVDLVCSVEDFGDLEFSVLRARQLPEPPSKATAEASRWFLVSDDRHAHLDSRDFGQVDPATCQQVVFRLASAAGFGDSRKRLTIVW